MNRVPVQSGPSLPAFLKQYGHRRAGEQALLDARWQEGLVCPTCAGRVSSTFLPSDQAYQLCSTCLHQTRLRADVMFDNTGLPPRPFRARWDRHSSLAYAGSLST